MSKPKNRQPKTTKNASGHIRIIAGKWRGRKLPVHDIQGLRPTTDRVKETVFNWLMNDIHSSHCLDCFAGAGSLGFEALSRSAKNCTFIEKDKQAARQLTANKHLLNADNATIIEGDCLSTFNKLNDQFDVVFIDPPFRQDLVNRTINQLVSNNLLTPKGLIYLEIESELQGIEIPTNWDLLKQKTAGQVTYSLYQVNEQNN